MAPRTPKDPAQKPAKAKAAKASPKPAKPAAAEGDAPKAAVLKLKDLVDQVAAATGAKKPESRKAVEATLAAIQAALTAGTTLVLPPLGKLKAVKTSGAVTTLKLRGAKAENAAGKPLAEDGEDD